MTRSSIDINCDMSEGFGAWSIQDGIDESMLPLVSSVNVAAGFHAGDPNIIRGTVAAAVAGGVGVGVHPGFRDLVGFGRRHIDATSDELVNDVIYQLGAVRELLALEGKELQHLKLHGALYMHAAANEEFARQLIDTLQVRSADLPVLVMAGTAIDRVAVDRGQPVIREFYADRRYGDDGRIVFTRDAGSFDPQEVADKVVQACQDGTVRTVTGACVPVEFESVCIHSDTRGAHELMSRTRAALDEARIRVRSFVDAD